MAWQVSSTHLAVGRLPQSRDPWIWWLQLWVAPSAVNSPVTASLLPEHQSPVDVKRAPCCVLLCCMFSVSVPWRAVLCRSVLLIVSFRVKVVSSSESMTTGQVGVGSWSVSVTVSCRTMVLCRVRSCRILGRVVSCPVQPGEQGYCPGLGSSKPY